MRVTLDFGIGYLALGNIADVALNDLDTFAVVSVTDEFNLSSYLLLFLAEDHHI
jgi:hypothetical protein